MVLVGLSMTNYASERLAKYRAGRSVEGYEYPKSSRYLDMGDGMEDGLYFVLYIVGLTFLLLELILLFFAMTAAFRCSKPGLNRVVHVTLALFFTAPYVLFSIFLGDCAGKI